MTKLKNYMNGIFTDGIRHMTWDLFQLKDYKFLENQDIDENKI